MISKSSIEQCSKKIASERNKLELLKQKLDSNSPGYEIGKTKEYVMTAKKRLDRAAFEALREKRHQFVRQIEALQYLNPLALLKRGFGLTYKEGELVKEIEQIEPGDEVTVQMYGGTFQANVMAKEEKEIGEERTDI